MPQLTNFAIDTVKAVFLEHGIHVLEEFQDGQIMWGNEPLVSPYTGSFHMADFYIPRRYDIFTIRAILSKLDKAGSSKTIEDVLYKSLENEEYEVHEPDPSKE